MSVQTTGEEEKKKRNKPSIFIKFSSTEANAVCVYNIECIVGIYLHVSKWNWKGGGKGTPEIDHQGV